MRTVDAASERKSEAAQEVQTEVYTATMAVTDPQTRVGSVLGTPAFMAPEQARGEVDRLDERCDVFGLGAILCVILTGKPPFIGKASDDTRRLAERGDLADALVRLDGCGAEAELVQLAKRCLAPQPNDRPRTAMMVAREFTGYLASVQQRMRAAELARAAAQAAAAKERKTRRLTVALATTILLAIATCGSAGAWWLHQRAEMIREVETALAEATTLGKNGKWEEASSATHRAQVLLAGGGPKDLRARMDRIQSDVDMVSRLETIRLRASDAMEDGHFSVARTDEAYSDAFRQYDLDVTAVDSVEEAAERVRTSAIADHLIAGLDEWAWCKAHHGDAKGTASCLVVAIRSDSDPWRNRLRNPNIWLNKEALEELAADPEAAEQPTPTIALFANALAEANATPAAVRVLSAAQQRRPDDFWLNHELAYYLCRLKPPRKDEAVGFYRAALAIRPNSPGVHNNLGILLAEQGKLPEAEAAYRRAITLQSDYFFAHNNLGNLLAKQDRNAEAEAAYRQAIAVKSDYFESHFHLAQLLESQGKTAEAVEMYGEAASLEPFQIDPQVSSGALNAIGLALYNAGKFPDAVTAFRKACDLNPEEPDYQSNLGIALSEAGDQPAAITACKEAIHLRSDFGAAHKNLGLALQRHGELDAAIKCYEEAIRLRPEDSQAYSNLGSIYLQIGLPDKAQVACEKARFIQPKNADAHFNLGLALAAKGRHADAVTAFREELVLRKRAETYLQLAHSLELLGKLGETEEAYRRLLELRPDDAQAHYNLGVILEARHEYAQAVDAYRQAIKHAPKLEVAHCNLGIALESQRIYGEATDAFRHAIELDPKDALAHYGLGRVLKAQSQYDAALEAMRIADKIGSADPNWNHPTAQWVKMLERLVELDRKLGAILRGDAKPASARERLNLAQLCHQDGKELFAAAAQFFLDSFAEEPRGAEQREPDLRYQAACVAALAGCSQGRDADSLDDKGRVKWREQALAWLRADLAVWTKQLDTGKQGERTAVRQSLQHWMADDDLAGVRDKDAIARLPEAEREAWRKLWADVQTILKRAENK
jgi:tetratricopeptide (TPR) repeat protein